MIYSVRAQAQCAGVPQSLDGLGEAAAHPAGPLLIASFLTWSILLLSILLSILLFTLLSWQFPSGFGGLQRGPTGGLSGGGGTRRRHGALESARVERPTLDQLLQAHDIELLPSTTCQAPAKPTQRMMSHCASSNSA